MGTPYRRHLEKSGFVNSRSGDLDKAMRRLHSAICQLDEGQLRVAQKFLNTKVCDLINEFALIEELRRGF